MQIVFTSSLRRATSLAIATRRAIHATPPANSELPTPPRLASLENGEQSREAESWLRKFEDYKISRSDVQLTFSRSSGPGGQNVNKVNTKATLRCPIDVPWIPLWAREHIKKTSSYVSSSQSILITSTVFRSQAQNVQDCLTKLHSLIVSATSASLIVEPTEEKKARIRDLERIEKAQRRLDKDKRRDVKRGRSGRGRDWD